MQDRLDPREALCMPPLGLISEPDADDGATEMVAATGCVEIPGLGRIYELQTVWRVRLSAN